MKMMQLLLEGVESVLTLFFVTVATLGLTATMLDTGRNPIAVQIAGIALIVVMSILLPVRFLSRAQKM